MQDPQEPDEIIRIYTTEWKKSTIAALVATAGAIFALSIKPPPELPKGTPVRYQRIFRDAFEDAKRRILDKPECAKFFGGRLKALEGLYKPEYRFLPLEKSSVGAATYKNGRISVFVNTKGPFVSDTMSIQEKMKIFGIALTGTPLRSLILLHELGHVRGIFKRDVDDLALNLKYTKQVLDHCFK